MLKKLMLTIAFSTFCLSTASAVKGVKDTDDEARLPAPSLPAPKKQIEKTKRWAPCAPLRSPSAKENFQRLVTKYPDLYEFRGNIPFKKS